MNISNHEFLSLIGPKINSGTQGSIYLFADNDIVKIWHSYNFNNIINEVNIAKLASDYSLGPEIYDFRQIGNKFYMVMEKVYPITPTKKIFSEITNLFQNLISIGIVNFDGTFARNKNGNLILLDYGVSILSSDARKKYCENDYFFLLERDKKIYDINKYFC